MFDLSKILLKTLLFALFYMLCSFCAMAQDADSVETQTTAIQLVSAEKWFYSKNKHNNAQVIIGDVVLMHDSATMYCDSALLYKELNTLEAFGNVHIIEDDTIHLYGKFLKYNGQNKLINIKEDVRMVDPTTTLLTDELFYNRVDNVAYYLFGATIYNEDNELVSRKGYYNTSTSDFTFHQDVVITNPEYILTSDTMLYNTNTKIVVAIDTTHIYNKTNTMVCKSGIYNMDDDVGFFDSGVEIYYDNYILFSDSLFYDNIVEYAEAYRDVVVIDTTNNVTSWSEYLEYSKEDGYAFIADSAKVRMISETDTLFAVADTLYATFDSTLIDITMYRNVKLLHRDFQAVCDSAVVYKADSCMKLFKTPALWSSDNQITGDTIVFNTENNELKNIYVPINSFIVSQDSIGQFNQIKGEELYIYFNDKVINYMDIVGNSQAVYFLLNDNGSPMGTSITSSINSKVIFIDGKMHNFIFYEEIESDMLPSDKTDPSRERLDGLEWRVDERPDYDFYKKK